MTQLNEVRPVLPPTASPGGAHAVPAALATAQTLGAGFAGCALHQQYALGTPPSGQ